MERLLIICTMAGFIFAAASPALADDVLPPPWIGEDRTVYAAWGNWTDFPAAMPPDTDPYTGGDMWYSIPEVEGFEPPIANAFGDAVLHDSNNGRASVIEMSGDYELVFSMPNFADGEYKEVWVQVTYYQMSEEQHPLFDVDTDEGFDMTEPAHEDSQDWGDGWVTEAWSFRIQPNPEWEDIWLNFADGYPAYVDQVVIDTICIPEPVTICLLGIGSLVLLKKRKNNVDKLNKTCRE